ARWLVHLRRYPTHDVRIAVACEMTGVGRDARDGHVERDVAHCDPHPAVELFAQSDDRAEVLAPGEGHAVEDHRAAATEVVAGGVEYGRDRHLALGGREVAGPEERVANDVLVEHAGVRELRRE